MKALYVYQEDVFRPAGYVGDSHRSLLCRDESGGSKQRRVLSLKLTYGSRIGVRSSTVDEDMSEGSVR